MQTREFWEVLGKQPGQQKNFVCNVVYDLATAAKEVRYHAYENFSISSHPYKTATAYYTIYSL